MATDRCSSKVHGAQRIKPFGYHTKQEIVYNPIRRKSDKKAHDAKLAFFLELVLFLLLLILSFLLTGNNPFVFAIGILAWIIYLPFSPNLQAYLFQRLQMEKFLTRSLLRPRRIILIRHGESLGNVDTTTYSRIPDNQVPLTARGIEQAQEAGRALRRIVGEETIRFFVSPYKRCRQTYEHLLVGAQIKEGTHTYREEPRLREQDFGNYQDPDAVKRSMGERRQFGSFYYRFPNGESGADVYDRVTTFWASLYREFKYSACLENFVLVSHGMTLRLFLMRYYKWSVEEFHELWNLDNCQIVVMELDARGKNYRLTAPLKRNAPKGLVSRPKEEEGEED